VKITIRSSKSLYRPGDVNVDLSISYSDFYSASEATKRSRGFIEYKKEQK